MSYIYTHTHIYIYKIYIYIMHIMNINDAIEVAIQSWL